MTANILSHYQTIAQAMADNIPEEWDKAYMLIGRQDGVISNSGNGKYADDSDLLKVFSIRDKQLKYQVTDAVTDIYRITTEGGHNRWNFLWFALLPSGAYELDFLWHQDAQDVLDHLEQTSALARPQRAAALNAFEQAQAERRSPALYDNLVRAVLALIPEQWVTATLSLREAGIGYIEHHAAYRSPTEEADDALHLPYSWPALLAVEELRRLKKKGGHPNWEKVEFVVEATGRYRANFFTELASAENPASGYYYEGQWQAPPAQLPG
ncbi:hypothetical protein QMK33_20345 [Hymenobacter sp. H14-R3]|uniref:immunity protein YezG family protein n=1 Tax=Hymenobacter sp. H14-R3 TaxID=3046308 RepID=UPI0024BB16B6|nr:hypothetical protein [Hymenobacter sp. H14-R3]MDJ0367507.1 hypothetical protein [Hymenobacter sp. H14-R3]